ncbi:MAG TPA: FUSC family protein, partial [Roseomonas sp.]
TDAAQALLAAAAALLGGLSRPFGIAAARFIPFVIIMAHMGDGTGHGSVFLLPMAAGAAWTAALSFLLGTLLRPGRSAAAPPPAEPAMAPPFARWTGTLATLSGWQYALRLGLCLAVAGLLRTLWPDHHLHWVALTVALLSQRQLELLPVKATQRALGTALGVLAGSLFIVHRPPDWGLVAGLGLLAAARPLLKARNYLAYSAIMTPLITLIMDAGQPLGLGVLADRLVATLIGAALVIATNLAFSALVEAG